MNSAKMIASDSDFVREANQKIHEITSDIGFSIDSTNKKDIVFAIITKDSGNRPHLPLFSKISLTHAMDRLKSMDYKGKLAAIHIK
mgnify:CR=1 FL=1